MNAPSQDVTISQTETPTAIIETFTPTFEGCYFVWATYPDSELTDKLDSTVKQLNANASASATLYGEDCVYADGHTTFGVMETNISVVTTVDDLSKHEEFGNWIKDVMQFLIELPREELQGNYGKVEFRFKKNESEILLVTVPIQKYLDEAKDKTGIELFNLFYQAQ
ncbi:MAG: hypothetical protein UZ14_CFX002000327 [Chloroflexi bacterium OLB14]|nr:MAG: hypothetical protein UZ14_CFX002000327 [Chloroflexi bacterium OLB14]